MADKRISDNFTVAKFLSIMMVVVGHNFDDFTLIWVPTTTALIVFSFSSAYFTSLKYVGNYSLKQFWLRKAERLGVNLSLINVVLLVLFVAQGQSGIFSWHSLINIVGLNGFLNWLHVDNVSPYGRGMWFLTLLLLFYAVYPLLGRVQGRPASISAAVFILVAFMLSRQHDVGHALYITACGFVIGVLAAKRVLWIAFPWSLAATIVVFLTMLLTNWYLNWKLLNFFLILSFSVFGIFALLGLRLPRVMVRVSAFFSSCLLEIYLLHPYIDWEATSSRSVNFVIHVAIVLGGSKILSLVSSWVLGSLGRRGKAAETATVKAKATGDGDGNGKGKSDGD